MKIWTKIVKWIFFQAANYLYNYIDKDNDGKLSKKEIKEFNEKIKFILNKVKKKN